MFKDNSLILSANLSGVCQAADRKWIQPRIFFDHTCLTPLPFREDNLYHYSLGSILIYFSKLNMQYVEQAWLNATEIMIEINFTLFRNFRGKDCYFEFLNK